MLEAWLDYHRDTLLMKCAGLSPERLAERSCPPSSLSLLGLVRHMSEVERSWFQRGLEGRTDVPPLYYSDDDPDGDFDNAAPENADEALPTFRAAIEAARDAAARHGLEDFFERGSGSERERFSLRWVYVHMIEEYARHNGHADLLRERIDGATGD
jgi:uncharacterized damage-inducible protein DinB